jgi:N-acetylmuramoyl-L-alanine amidase-like
MAKKPILVGLLGLTVAAIAWLIQGRADAADGAAPVQVTAAAPTGESSWDDADWGIFQRKVRDALAARLDTLPMGEVMARLGRTFVGTRYVPRTLEAGGPEHLVIDFRGLDCVTLVETAFAMSRFVKSPGAGALLDRRAAAEARYDSLLTQIRYRGGRVDGYPSRLHYFSDWIEDNERKGLVRNVTEEIGGVRDTEPVDFMSTHADAYRQLADPVFLDAIRRREAALTAEGRWFVPKNEIAAVAPKIRDGDIIAATSTVRGLDVAHTGLAVWIDGELRLVHAPLVGDSVQVSDVSLARRIRGIPGQDGIMVARPVGEP